MKKFWKNIYLAGMIGIILACNYRTYGDVIQVYEQDLYREEKENIEKTASEVIEQISLISQPVDKKRKIIEENGKYDLSALGEEDYQAPACLGYIRKEGKAPYFKIFVGAKRRSSALERLGKSDNPFLVGPSAHTERQLVAVALSDMKRFREQEDFEELSKKSETMKDSKFVGTIIIRVIGMSPCDNAKSEDDAGGWGCLEYYTKLATDNPDLKIIVYVNKENLAISSDCQVNPEYMVTRGRRELSAVQKIFNSLKNKEIKQEMGKRITNWQEKYSLRMYDFLSEGEGTIRLNESELTPLFTKKIDDLRAIFADLEEIITKPLAVTKEGMDKTAYKSATKLKKQYNEVQTTFYKSVFARENLQFVFI